MEVLGIFVSLILGVLLPIVFVGGIIYLIMYMVKQKGKPANWNLLFRGALKLYTYSMLTITLFIFITSMSVGLKAIFASLTEYGFSYEYEYYYRDYDGYSESSVCIDDCEIVEYDNEEYKADLGEIKSDMVYGGLAALVTLFLAGIHYGLKRYLESDSASNGGLHKSYVLFNLMVYSITALGAILIGIKGLADYWLLDEDVYSYGASHPGTAVAMALLFTPVWLIYLFVAVKMFRKSAE